MNTSVNELQPGQQASSANKPLWAAVGILGVAVLAMGGTMIYQQRAMMQAATPVALAAPAAKPAATATAADDLVEKPAAVAAKPEPVAAPVKKVVKPTPKPAPAPSYAGVSPAPSYYPAPAVAAAPVCAVCGAVDSVTPVQRSTKPEGVGIGTVAGGVLGAVLGNQVGHGGGRTAATILGAVGGGFAGNAIEKHVRKETVYQVGVRMDDGSHRVVEVAQPPQIGTHVTVEGSSIRSRDGATYNAPAPVVVRQPQPVYTNNSNN